MAASRRELLRMAAPAVALPMVASPLQAKEIRLVTRGEIMAAFRFYDFMELRAEDLNLRYQILIDLLFETNPDTLRAKLQQLHDSRRGRHVLVDANSGQTTPYHPDMYDHASGEMRAFAQRNVDQAFKRNLEQLQDASKLTGLLPKPKLRHRVAAWLVGWRA